MIAAIASVVGAIAGFLGGKPKERAEVEHLAGETYRDLVVSLREEVARLRDDLDEQGRDCDERMRALAEQYEQRYQRMHQEIEALRRLVRFGGGDEG